MKGMEGMGEEESRGWMDGFVSGEIVYSKIEWWEIDFFPKDVVFISAHPRPALESMQQKNGACMSFPRPEMGRGGKESLSLILYAE